MNPIHTETYRGLTIKLYQDPDPESPREWSNLGVMFCRHRRCSLGDNRSEPPPKVGAVVLPLYLYDHSGITISTKPFSCPWDSGQVGVIYCTADVIKREFGSSGKRARAKAVKALEQEVRTYDQYLRGDVYGYVVEDRDGEHLDSCWGFYQNERPDADDSYILREARESADHHADKIEKTETETQIAECCP